MGIGATILMTIFFPLNSFLLLQEAFSGGSQVEANVSNASIADGDGLVKGVEFQKKEKLSGSKPKAVEVPKYQVVRKDGIKDLVVPNAHASVIIDVESGTILHYNEGRAHRQIASLTKIMTAILVVEKIKDLDKEEIEIDEEAIYADGTKIGCPRSGFCNSQRLKIDEKVSARNLLRAALINSANDAAIALGKHIAGSQKDFADIMNKKAKELGLTDTHFCTASGLEEPAGQEKECYSSAYDIARIAAYSLRYKDIWNVYESSFSEDNLEISSADEKIKHSLINTVSNLSQVPNALGGKTGFTPLAGYSLLTVTADPSGKHQIVSVVLDDINRWQDIKTMTNWAFASYEWR